MGDHETVDMIRIPLPGKPKARPRVAKGNTYMPADYTDWKEAVGWALKEQGIEPAQIEVPLNVHVIFKEDEMLVQLFQVEKTRPKGTTGDLDNLVGGLLDALQDYGLIKDDRQVQEIWTRFGVEED